MLGRQRALPSGSTLYSSPLAAPILRLISFSVLTSLVNKTLRYLNSFTWDNASFPTWTAQSTGFLLRTMASDLETLILKTMSDNYSDVDLHALGLGTELVMRRVEPMSMLWVYLTNNKMSNIHDYKSYLGFFIQMCNAINYS